MPHGERGSVGQEFNREDLASEEKTYWLLRAAHTADEIRAAFTELDGGEPLDTVKGLPPSDELLLDSKDARLKRAREFLVRHGIPLE